MVVFGAAMTVSPGDGGRSPLEGAAPWRAWPPQLGEMSAENMSWGLSGEQLGGSQESCWWMAEGGLWSLGGLAKALNPRDFHRNYGRAISSSASQCCLHCTWKLLPTRQAEVVLSERVLSWVRKLTPKSSESTPLFHRGVSEQMIFDIWQNWWQRDSSWVPNGAAFLCTQNVTVYESRSVWASHPHGNIRRHGRTYAFYSTTFYPSPCRLASRLETNPEPAPF